MPTYEYECAAHGTFDLYRPMSESGQDADCPACGLTSSRVICAPNLRTMSPLKRSATERNERSRHAPHVCGSGCNHQHGPTRKPAAAIRPGAKPALTAYTGPRPWVIEHS